MPATKEKTIETVFDDKRDIEWETCSPEEFNKQTLTRHKNYFSYGEHEKKNC